MRKIGGVAIALTYVVALAACGQQNDPRGTAVQQRTVKTGGNAKTTLNRGLLGEPSTLDPQLADDTYSFQVIRDLYEGLTAEDRAGRIVPGVASSWQIDSSGTVYTFHLRRDAEWSDGSRIVAPEFVQGLRRAVDPLTASGSADNLLIIKGAADIIAGRKKVSELGASALGEDTVQIQLEHPAPFILEILSQPTAAPFHTIAAAEKRESSATNLNPSTNGAYVLAAHVPGSFIELSRNPHYWNKANVGIDKVRYINSDSEATELREYLAGQLDLTFTIPAQDLNRISRQYPNEVQNEPFLATLYLALNLDRYPLKESLNLRKALSMSVDRQIIADRIMMGVTPAYSLVAQGVADYPPAVYKWSKLTHDQQLTEAKSLYKSVGYSKENPLHLTLYFNQDEGIRRLMVAVAGSWRQNLGIESELVSDEFRVFLLGRKDKIRWDCRLC
jgi:oligopeptide transport system substrate-binding protein